MRFSEWNIFGEKLKFNINGTKVLKRKF
jgi:hypothetical protein